MAIVNPQAVGLTCDRFGSEQIGIKVSPFLEAEFATLPSVKPERLAALTIGHPRWV